MHIKLNEDHTHEGRLYHRGDLLVVDDKTAEWIVKHGRGRVVDGNGDPIAWSPPPAPTTAVEDQEETPPVGDAAPVPEGGESTATGQGKAPDAGGRKNRKGGK